MGESPADTDATRVLLVDDGEDFLRVATELLARPGLVVDTANGTDNLVDLARHLQPDVVLIGLDMPGLRGLESIRRLRETLPAAGIVALTLSDRDVYRRVALAAGAAEVVCKADLVAELLPAIRRVRGLNGVPVVAE